MELKIAVWTHYFREFTVEEKLEEFAKAGFKYLEFSSEDGELLLNRGKPKEEGEAYRRRAADLGIEVSQGHLNLEANLLNRSDLEGLKTWLELFNAAGIKNCVLHYGKSPAVSMPPERLLAKRGDALKELKEVIKGTDMRICLENLFKDKDCSTLLGLIKYVGEENMGICLDTGHLNLAGGNQAGFVMESGSLLHALHIADNEGYYDQHLMPFFGRTAIPWAELMKALGANNYNGLFNFEIPGECASAPIEVRRMKLRYLKELAAYLQTLT